MPCESVLGCDDSRGLPICGVIWRTALGSEEKKGGEAKGREEERGDGRKQSRGGGGGIGGGGVESEGLHCRAL